VTTECSSGCLQFREREHLLIYIIVVFLCYLVCLILVPRKFTIVYHFKQQVRKKFRGWGGGLRRRAGVQK